MIRTIALSALAMSVLSPVAFASCDISLTKCAVNGGKCNIKFRNVTGAESGSDKGTRLTQKTSAQTIRIKALKDNGEKTGNALTINAGANKTMNIDKKARRNFDRIRITSPALATIEGITMSCSDVQQVLNGNGTCKIFNGNDGPEFGIPDYKLGFSCDGGNVTGPKG